MIDLSTFRALLSPLGQEALQAAQALEPREADFLIQLTLLQKSFPDRLARAALEMAILRGEASSKFPFADKMYFTRPALEQTTGYEISSYRAGRYRGFERILDLGCSIGGDTLALASIAPTIGIDLDALRLNMAQANMHALTPDNWTSFIQADLISTLPFWWRSKAALFFDPARRDTFGRVFSVRKYLPPLTVIQDWLSNYPALGVKISPGVQLAEVQSYNAEVEFISSRGELKEAVLWFGPLKTAVRRATVLPGPHTLTASEASARPGSAQSSQWLIPLGEPLRYLYEPDPSILRAGLVQDLGVLIGARQLDTDIAYLTSDQWFRTPFAHVWQIECWFPFGIKRLRAELRQRGVGRVVVKKRGSPLQPEELIRKLHLERNIQGDLIERVIVLTHFQGRPIVILCFPQSQSQEDFSPLKVGE